MIRINNTPLIYELFKDLKITMMIDTSLMLSNLFVFYILTAILISSNLGNKYLQLVYVIRNQTNANLKNNKIIK